MTLTKSEFELLKKDFGAHCINENARNQFAETIKRNCSVVPDVVPEKPETETEG